MDDDTGDTVHTRMCRSIRRRYDKPGRVFLGIVSRLDRETTGVLVLARTSKAASRLNPQYGGPGDHGKFPPAEKVYLAWLDGSPPDAEFVWEDRLLRDNRARRMRVVRNPSEGAVAVTRGVVLVADAGRTLVALRIETGRKHQIRVQAAARGHAVFGDEKYGRPKAGPMLLHSHWTQIVHPTRRDVMGFRADPPSDWPLWTGSGAGHNRRVPRRDERIVTSLHLRTPVEIHPP